MPGLSPFPVFKSPLEFTDPPLETRPFGDIAGSSVTASNIVFYYIYIIAQFHGQAQNLKSRLFLMMNIS